MVAWSSYRAGQVEEAVGAASRALDLDPVHAEAIWIAVLGRIRQVSARA